MGDARALPTVQLLHELVDGTSHVDWMIAQDPRGTLPLVTFRLAARVDQLTGGTATAERLPDHRPAYLEYEGPVAGNRGKVRRLAKGLVVRWERGSDSWRIEVAWDGPPGAPPRQELLLERLSGGTWRVEAQPATPGG
jgi:hypothetical protein